MGPFWLLACAEPASDPVEADADSDADADADADTDVDPWEVPLDTAAEGFGILLVEALADPTIDANCDGVVDAGDAFAEIVNVGTIEVDLGGSTLEHAGGMRKTFPLETLVPPGGAVLVFDGGAPGSGAGTAPWCPLPPDVQVLVVDRPMELPPCGDFRLDLAGPVGAWLDLFRADRLDCPGGQSLVRTPELTRDAPIVWHGELSGAAASPGTHADGTSFGP